LELGVAGLLQLQEFRKGLGHVKEQTVAHIANHKLGVLLELLLTVDLVQKDLLLEEVVLAPR
jgi:hypothetical protein